MGHIMTKKDEFNPNDEQKEVINFGKGNLLVEAGPGSGKTTVIVERIKKLISKGVNPETFLVMTFTRKAAENLQLKLKKELDKEIVSKMQISTIHSFCLEFLKDRNQTINLIDDDSDERKELFVRKNKYKLGFTDHHIVKNYQFPSVVDKFSEYTNFKVKTDELIDYVESEKQYSQEYERFIDENRYFSKKRIEEAKLKEDWYNARFQQTARAYPEYLKLLNENSLVDYNTLQLKALEELESNGETKYKTVLIDEFQDTDPLQYRIFKILLRQADYFTAVGDIDQRIYSFRSTFKDYFDELEQEFETTRISLNCNYRSTKDIVNLTDSFIKYQRSEFSKKELKAKNQKYDNPSFLVETEISQKRNEKKFGYLNEAHKILEIIEKLDENGQISDFSDIAVLYRKHASNTISYLIDLLYEAEIPFSVKGRKDLEKQKEVKAIIILWWYITRKTDYSYISSQEEYNWINLSAFYDENLEGAFWKLADSTKDYIRNLQESFEDKVKKVRNELNPSANGRQKIFRTTHKENEQILIEIYNNVEKPVIDLDKITDENDKAFFEKLESLRNKTFSKEPPEILEVYYQFLEMSAYFDDVESNINQASNLATLSQSMSNYEEFISSNDIRGFYFFLTQTIRNFGAYYGDDGGVQLMTVHAAKGLEFPVTIVASIEKKEFPKEVKDPKRKASNIMFKDTFYTPNDCLEYKYFTDENGEYRPVTIEEENKATLEEEERVIYVAMTRAADLLIVSSLGELPDRMANIKDCFKPFSFKKLEKVKIDKHFENSEEEQLVLNYSKYTKFCSCPFKYNLGYNLGFSRPGAKAANRGTVFHEIMEKVNLKLIEGKKVENDELINIIYEVYGSMFDINQNPEEYGEFKDNVINYYEKYAKEKEVLGAELDFEIDMGEYLLNGAIDLIYKTGENELVILDYKYAEFDENHIDGYIKQSHLYAAAVKEMPEFKDYTVKKAIIHFVLKDHPHIVEINDEDVSNELKGLDEVAKKIKKGNFSKYSDDCERCVYRIFCKK